MARNRTIYQSEALYVGPTGSGHISQLSRVQTFNSALNIARTDVNQFGQLAAIDRIITEAPTVPIDFSYYLTNGANETGLGFSTQGTFSCISGILSKRSDEHNFYLKTVSEGSDAVNNTSYDSHFVTAVGNAFITNYTAEASVGGFATASVSAEALNLRIYVGSTGKRLPTIDPLDGQILDNVINFSLPVAISGAAGEPTAIGQGDILVQLVDPGIGVKLSGDGSAHIQSFSLNVPLARENLNRLGTRFSYSKEIQFPITVSMSLSATLADLQAGNLDTILCDDGEKTLRVVLREPTCQGNGDPTLVYTLRGAKLDNQNFSSSIGANKSVDMTFSAQIAGPEDLTRGLFISGSSS